MLNRWEEEQALGIAKAEEESHEFVPDYKVGNEVRGLITAVEEGTKTKEEETGMEMGRRRKERDS